MRTLHESHRALENSVSALSKRIGNMESHAAQAKLDHSALMDMLSQQGGRFDSSQEHLSQEMADLRSQISAAKPPSRSLRQALSRYRTRSEAPFSLHCQTVRAARSTGNPSGGRKTRQD